MAKVVRPVPKQKIEVVPKLGLGWRLKEVTDRCKEIIGVAKDGTLVFCLLAILLFPTWTKSYLLALGLTSVSTPLGKIDLAKDQVRENTAVLTELETARRSLPPESEAAAAVESAIHTVQAMTLQAQNVVVEAQPGVLPTKGWIYLGTVNTERTEWIQVNLGRATRTVVGSYADLKPDTVVVVRADVNLRAAKPSLDGALPRVIGVLHEGERIRLLEIDQSRPAERDQPNLRGFEVFARVEQTADQDASVQ